MRHQLHGACCAMSEPIFRFVSMSSNCWYAITLQFIPMPQLEQEAKLLLG